MDELISHIMQSYEQNRLSMTFKEERLEKLYNKEMHKEDIHLARLPFFLFTILTVIVITTQIIWYIKLHH